MSGRSARQREISSFSAAEPADEAVHQVEAVSRRMSWPGTHRDQQDCSAPKRLAAAAVDFDVKGCAGAMPVGVPLGTH